jgi:hypothetical protein
MERIMKPRKKKTVEVPFEDLPHRDVTLHDGLGTKCPNGSEVEVWKIKDEDSFHIKLRRKLDDGRMSLLQFGTSKESAIALEHILAKQIYPEEKIES